ncbi:MAG: exonuclease domain-containing protein [Candidatus Omnitrophica bacterium]|nr:exonuclease domain-containing protein [Candidatus Omnitrophota bacterium]
MKIPELIALDTETTGLDPETDRICEIALLKIRDEKIVEKFTTLINPEIEIPESVSLISGIFDEDVKKAPLFKEIVNKINDIINGKIILCHNANFDIPFLKKEFERCKIKFPKIKIIDTYLIAKNFFCFEKNSLSYLSNFFHIKRVSEHRAEDDAKATFEIFKILYEEMEKKYSAEDILQKINFDINKIEDKMNINTKVAKLIEEGKEVVIIYMSNTIDVKKKSKITERKILPIEIIEENGVKYLKAFCYLRKEERKFRFDRILNIVENDVKE